MTDEQIVKALECCVSSAGGDACRGCPYEEEGICVTDGLALTRDSLGLIKRQQAEIGRLKYLNKVLERDVFNAEMNLESVSYELELIKQEKKSVQAEAVREFAERLKKRLDRKHTIYGREYILRHMRELVKEMEEEK